MFYAGFGSRKTPGAILQLMERIGTMMAQKGYILRSGGAEGADTSFYVGARRARGAIEVYRPQDAKGVVWALNTVDMFHPDPKKVGQGVRLLHARNAMIMLGREGQAPCEFGICWTPGGQVKGGSGQTIRIAVHHEIPLVNLGNKQSLFEAEQAVMKWEEKQAQG